MPNEIGQKEKERTSLIMKGHTVAKQRSDLVYMPLSGAFLRQNKSLSLFLCFLYICIIVHHYCFVPLIAFPSRMGILESKHFAVLNLWLFDSLIVL